MKTTKMIEIEKPTPYRKGFPNFNGAILDHDEFVALVHEAHQKMMDTKDEADPFTLPIYISQDDQYKVYKGEEVQPVGYVKGVRFVRSNPDYDTDYKMILDIETDIGNLGLFDISTFVYNSVVGVINNRRSDTPLHYVNKLKNLSFHLSSETDNIIINGKLEN